MKVEFPEYYGFCSGVKIAVGYVEDAIENGITAHTLGPIVHNKQLVEKFAEKGVEPIEDLSEADADNIIIRAHGISPEKEREIEERGLKILHDGTCPLVKKAQKCAEDLKNEDYTVVVIGEDGHAEVEALKSYGDAIAVLESGEDVNNLYNDSLIDRNLEKIGAVLQTTQSEERVNDVFSNLIHKPDEIKIYNTRCKATQRRQKAIIDLASKDGIDGAIVAGGYHSSNTTRLAEVSTNYAPTIHIETKDDLRKEENKKWLKEKDTVALTGGASTPNYILEDVREELEEKY